MWSQQLISPTPTNALQLSIHLSWCDHCTFCTCHCSRHPAVSCAKLCSDWTTRYKINDNGISILSKWSVRNLQYNGTVQGLYSLSDGRFTARFREISKPRDLGLNFFNRSENSQTPRQRRCRDACQISERYARFNGKTSYHLLNRGPGWEIMQYVFAIIDILTAPWSLPFVLFNAMEPIDILDLLNMNIDKVICGYFEIYHRRFSKAHPTRQEK